MIETSDSESEPSSASRWLLPGLVLLYFALRAAYLAVALVPGLPPDEVTHLGKVEVFAAAFGTPPDTEATHHLGVLARQPNLYYQVLGLAARASTGLTWLRLCNVVLGLAAAVYVWRVAGLLCGDAATRVVALIAVTNTMMFTALAGAVSYDNLTNLLAAAATYYLLHYLKTRAAGSLVGWIATAALGCLGKAAFVPLAFLLTVALVVRERGRLTTVARELGALLRPTSAAGAARLLLVLLPVAGCTELYGGNLLRYRRLVPGKDQVLGLEAALRNRIFARNWIVAEYRAGNLTYEEARDRAEAIAHEGDRGTCLSMLQLAEREKARGGEPRRYNRIDYLTAWTVTMVERTVGYIGHRMQQKSSAELYVYFAVLAIAGLRFVRLVRRDAAGGLVGWAGFVAFGYALVLLWLVNYPSYLRTGSFGIGLQGRYLFPVIAPAWCLTVRYLIHDLPARWRVIAGAALALWLAWGDVPWLVRVAGADWFGG